MQLAAFLCVICVICGRITRKRTQSIHTQETPTSLPLIPQIYADKQQNSLNLKLTVFLCEIMQPAAFLSAWSAGEYASKLTQSILLKWNSSVSRWSRRFTQTNNKTALISPPSQTVFLCEIMQPRCIPLRDLRNLRENNTQEDSINPHKRNPSISRRSRRFTQTKPQNDTATLVDAK